ncbi:MAG: transcriptional repressor [Desulfobacterales bacterium]|nr:transcriptional repressor [Desulfobacterales bacterium]
MPARAASTTAWSATSITISGHHHDHMICTKCGKIIEFKEDRLEDYQIQIAAAHGFHMLRHKMEIYGICADCLKERSRQMPLTMAKAGERLLIREISGGATSRVRLMTMGLRPGDRVEVITNNGQGQLAISVDMRRVRPRPRTGAENHR